MFISIIFFSKLLSTLEIVGFKSCGGKPAACLTADQCRSSGMLWPRSKLFLSLDLGCPTVFDLRVGLLPKQVYGANNPLEREPQQHGLRHDPTVQFGIVLKPRSVERGDRADDIAGCEQVPCSQCPLRTCTYGNCEDVLLGQVGLEQRSEHICNTVSMCVRSMYTVGLTLVRGVVSEAEDEVRSVANVAAILVDQPGCDEAFVDEFGSYLEIRLA